MCHDHAFTVKMIQKLKQAVCCLLSGLLLIAALCGCTVRVKRSENTPAASDFLQQITLTISGIGLNQPNEGEADQQMLRAFEKATGTRVIIKTIVTEKNKQDYINTLQLMLSSSALPDLLVYPSVSDLAEQELFIHLRKYLQADAEWKSVPSPLSQALSFSADGIEEIVAVPLHYYLEGYFVNHSLLEEKKLTVPALGFSVDRLLSMVRTLGSDSPDFLPISGLETIPYWYPPAKNDAYRWGFYRNGAYLPADSLFQEGLAYAAKIRAACYPKQKPEEISFPTPAEQRKGWREGKTALYYGSTAEINEISKVNFPYSYIGIPERGGVLDADYIGITAGCADKQEAFELLKWLSFGKNGQRQRAELAAYSVTSPPLSTDPALLRRYFTGYPCRGIAGAVEAIDQAAVIGSDYLPSWRFMMEKRYYALSKPESGIKTASDWIREAVWGTLSYEQAAVELDRLMNWKKEEENPVRSNSDEAS